MTLRPSLILCLAALLPACSKEAVGSASEKDEPLYQEAVAYEKRNDLDQALNAFVKLTESRRMSPEAHLSAGLLFLNHKKDAVMANYHFRRVLELEPNHPRAELVRGQILNAQRLFLQTLPGQFFDQGSTARNAEIKALRDENERLKRELASSVRGGPAQPIPLTPEQRNTVNNQPTPTPTPAGPPPPPAYTVAKGDTLSSISRKVYGNANRWKDIYEANRGILSSPTNLTVGQSLRIPR